MRRKWQVAALVTLVAGYAQAAPAQPASACATPSELAALQMRVLQTELMVAALSCDQRHNYNQFVVHFGTDLKRHGGALQSYFARIYRRDSSSRLNSMVTRLANEASQRTYQDGYFCQHAGETFAAVLGTSGEGLSRLAALHPTAATHGVAPCTVEAAVAPAVASAGAAGGAMFTRAPKPATRPTLVDTGR